MTELRVRIADYAVARAGTMVTIGLGSCVAIILYDPVARVGGLAHVLLPDPAFRESQFNPAKFPGTIIPIMLREMNALGSNGRVKAWLVGGARMFGSLISSPTMNVGARNIIASRAALARAGIMIAGEDVGGESGRSVRFSIEKGTVVVKTVRGAERAL